MFFGRLPNQNDFATGSNARNWYRRLSATKQAIFMIASMRVPVARVLLPIAEQAAALPCQRMRSAPETGSRPSWLGHAHRPGSLSKRQEERHWRAGEGNAAMVLVECDCPIVRKRCTAPTFSERG